MIRAAFALVLLLMIGSQLNAQRQTKGVLVVSTRTSPQLFAANGATLVNRTLEPRAEVIDSMRWLPTGSREVFTRQYRLVIDSAGGVRAFSRLPAPVSPHLDSASIRRFQSFQHLSGDFAVSFTPALVGTALRSLPAALPQRRRITTNYEWTLNEFGVVETERGTRVTTYLRDTTIAGTRLWVVRDSSSLTREERWPVQTFLLDSAAHRRTSRGYRTSFTIYDPARAVIVTAYDTTRLQTTLHRELSGVGDFSTTQHLVINRNIFSELPAAYDARRDYEIAQMRKRSGGMVVAPTDSVGSRLARGDSRLLDSLLTAWQRTNIREVRDTIEEQLSWSRASWRAMLFPLAVAQRDTATAIRLADAMLYAYDTTISDDLLVFVLPVMEDPAKALHYGLSVDAPFYHAFYKLMRRPPVVFRNEGPACTATGCAMLLRYADRTDVDPRLRDLGIVTRFLLDPAGGFPALESRAHSGGTRIAQSMHRTALGYLNEWSRPGSGRPIPPPGAPEDAWVAWATPIGDFESIPVLQLYMLRTGRDLRREIRQRFDQATSDTTRKLFGEMLAHVDREGMSLAEAERLASSESEIMRNLAARIAHRFVGKDAKAPDSVVRRSSTSFLRTTRRALRCPGSSLRRRALVKRRQANR